MKKIIALLMMAVMHGRRLMALFLNELGSQQMTVEQDTHTLFWMEKQSRLIRLSQMALCIRETRMEVLKKCITALSEKQK